MVGRLRAHAELGEDRRDVLLDRGGRDHQHLRDALVRAPFGHQLEHLALARRELVEGALLALAAEELLDDLRVDRGAAASDAPHGLEEVVDLEHAVLQQVAEALGPLLEERERMARFDHL